MLSSRFSSDISSKFYIEPEGLGLFYDYSCGIVRCYLIAFKLTLGLGSGEFIALFGIFFNEAVSEPRSLQLTWYDSTSAILLASSAEPNCP